MSEWGLNIILFISIVYYVVFLERAGLVLNICMVNICCNGNPISTFPPYYCFHTLTKLVNRPGVAGAVLQTPQKDSLQIQLCTVSIWPSAPQWRSSPTRGPLWVPPLLIVLCCDMCCNTQRPTIGMSGQYNWSRLDAMAWDVGATPTQSIVSSNPILSK